MDNKKDDVKDDDEKTPLLDSNRLKVNASVCVESHQSTQQVYLSLPRGGEDISNDEDEHSERPPSTSYVCLGYTFSIIAGLCFTASNVGIKFATDASSWQMLFVRCLSQLTAMVPLMLWKKTSLFSDYSVLTRCYLAAQGVLGGVLLLAIFEAVERLPIGDCTAIFFSAPACTMLLSTCLLNEHCGIYRMTIGSLLVGGVVVLSRPPALFPPSEEATTDKDFDIVGLGFALAVPLLSAWIAIITRQARHVHYSVLVFWFAVGGFVVSSVGILGLDDRALFDQWDLKTWSLAVNQSVLGILGSILMTKAVCWVTPAKVMVIRSIQVLVAYLIQVLAFGTMPHISDIGGACLVVSAVLGISLEDTFVSIAGDQCRFM